MSKGRIYIPNQGRREVVMFDTSKQLGAVTKFKLPENTVILTTALVDRAKRSTLVQVNQEIPPEVRALVEWSWRRDGESLYIGWMFPGNREPRADCDAMLDAVLTAQAQKSLEEQAKKDAEANPPAATSETKDEPCNPASSQPQQP